MAAWMLPAAIAGANLLGSALSGRSAERAANTAAAAQERSAQLAAQASAFRPVGLTTRFGTSRFQVETDPETGLPRLMGAGYEASPEIRAYQDRLAALAGQGLTQAEAAQAAAAPLGGAAQSLFGLGAGYLAESPEAARQRAFNMLQDVRRPEQMREEARLASSVFGRGRAGVNIGGAGQPELFALARARDEQRARDVLAAEDLAQRQIGFGAGLFGTGSSLYGTMYQLPTQALSPFMTAFGAQQAVEQAALQPLEIGANLGGRAVNTAGAQALLQGGLGAAQTRLQGGLVGPTLLAQGLSNFGNQYMQQQQQNAMFDRLYGQGSPWWNSTAGAQARGVNLFGAGYSGPQLSAGQAADYFGGGYSPALFEGVGY
jgi:hypothetical protein